MNGIHQIIDDEHAVFFCHACDMGVAGCGVGIGVAPRDQYDRLDMPQAQALLKEMGCETVSEGMYGDFFLMPQSATTVFMVCWTPPLSI